MQAMSWVGIMDGKVVSTFWFVDNDGANVSVNQQTYLRMLKTDVYPKLIAKFGPDLSRYWFQQVSNLTCVQSGAAGCEKGFVKCYPRVPNAVDLNLGNLALILLFGYFTQTRG